MTTFTTEDREWAFWNNYHAPKYDKQTEIEFFWPLTEQIPLELDYTDCSKPQLTYPLSDDRGSFYTGGTWSNTIAPQLMVESLDTKGYLKIGGVKIGLDKKPSQFRTMLHKLLGFDWSEK